MTRMTGARRGAAVCAALLLAGLGLTACGDDGAARQEPTVQDESQGGSADSQAAQEDSDGGGSVPSGLTGEPLPDDWPAEILVPDGEVILVLPIGAGGYSVTIEGVDDGQARDLIDRMVSAGFTTTGGVTETGIGEEWVAEVIGAGYMAGYAYAGGGAGLPNVTIQLIPQA